MDTIFALFCNHRQDHQLYALVREVFNGKKASKENLAADLDSPSLVQWLRNVKMGTGIGCVSLFSVIFCLLALGLASYGCYFRTRRWLPQLQVLPLLSRGKAGKGLVLLKVCVFYSKLVALVIQVTLNVFDGTPSKAFRLQNVKIRILFVKDYFEYYARNAWKERKIIKPERLIRRFY